MKSFNVNSLISKAGNSLKDKRKISKKHIKQKEQKHHWHHWNPAVSNTEQEGLDIGLIRALNIWVFDQDPQRWLGFLMSTSYLYQYALGWVQKFGSSQIYAYLMTWKIIFCSKSALIQVKNKETKKILITFFWVNLLFYLHFAYKKKKIAISSNSDLLKVTFISPLLLLRNTNISYLIAVLEG